MLGEEGHALTVAARRPEKLADAAKELRDAGHEVEEVPANMTSEEEIQNVWTQSMNKELNGEGIKSLALCPGFVDTPMTDFIRDSVPAEEMIQVSDVSEAVRFALHVSPACVIPEIIFQRPGETL